MKKSISKTLLLCAVFSSFALSGCSTNPKYIPSEISFAEIHPLMFVEETLSLGAITETREVADKYVKYAMEDPSIATINEHGTITALKAGETNAIVHIVDTNKDIRVPVSVYENNLNSRGRNEVKANILEYQKNRGENKLVKSTETVSNLKYKDGNLEKMTSFDETIIVSKDDAYLLIDSVDKEIKTEGGSTSYSNGKWVFYTTKSFNTFIFHIDGATKTYMMVDSTSFVGVGTRFDALNAILANIFTSGADLTTNQLRQGYVGSVFTSGKSPLDFLNQTSFIPQAGSKDVQNGNLMFGIQQVFTEPIANEEEDDYDIPAGTMVTNTNTSRYLFDANVAKFVNYRTTDEYELNEHKYLEKSTAQTYFELDGFELEYPNSDEYSLVYDIFDL